MRLIHFSDTHLGFTESSKVDRETGVNFREQDTYKAFNAVIEQAIKLKPDLVIHAGDLFHSSRPSNRAIVTALVGFQQLSAAGIPVVLIAGNHSVPRVAATGSIFEVMRVFPKVWSAHRERYEVFKIGDAAVHCIPHMSTEASLGSALAAVRMDREKRFNVVVMHGAVRGTGERYSLGEFNEIAVGKATLGHLDKFDYVALGHYHKCLQVVPNAWYSGSPERFHQNEAGYKKGFLEVDLTSHKVTFHPLAAREIAVLPPIACPERSLQEIHNAVEMSLRKAAPITEKIVIVRLEQVDPTTWIELQRERRGIERQYAAEAFEVRWDHTSTESKVGKQLTTIGSLAMEFAAFMKTAKIEGLNRDRLRRLGERLIAEASEVETNE